MADAPDVTLDLTGLSCPIPLIKIKKQLKKMDSGQILLAISTDPGTTNDIERACQKDGHKLLDIKEDGNKAEFLIKAG